MIEFTLSHAMELEGRDILRVLKLTDYLKHVTISNNL